MVAINIYEDFLNINDSHVQYLCPCGKTKTSTPARQCAGIKEQTGSTCILCSPWKTKPRTHGGDRDLKKAENTKSDVIWNCLFPSLTNKDGCHIPTFSHCIKTKPK